MPLTAAVLPRPPVRRAALAVLGALALALVIAIAAGSGSGAAAGRLGGDYPEFYGAGRIVNDGDLTHLYDPARQAASQSGFYGSESDGLLYFGYPPHVAVAYAPLAALPYRVSWAVHTALMVAAALGALALVRPMVRLLREAFWPCAALAVTFLPLFVGIGGGQNTALSLVLLAWSWRAAHDGHDGLAGLALGLALFKPQVALPLIALHLVAGRRRLALAAATTGVATWLVGVALLGWGWLAAWLHALARFRAIDTASNRANAVSLPGVLDAVLGQGRTAEVIGVGLAALVGVGLVVSWRRFGRRDLDLAMAVALPGIILMSPHALYYDAGLLVLTALVVLDRRPRTLAAVLACWVLGAANGLASHVGLTPVVLVVMVALIGAYRLSAAYGRKPTLATGCGATSRRATMTSTPASSTLRRSRGSMRSS